MQEQASQTNWADFYARRGTAGRYPTEWVVRTLAGGNYPGLKLDKAGYRGARILDMGCGDGRNLPLLLDLGFEVHACEISPQIVKDLEALSQELHWPVRFAVGLNTHLPYPDRNFDYLLCCASCYYLDGTATWPAVRKELARTVKPGGLLIANFPDENNFILADSVRLPDGSLRITRDPYGLRNGSRFVAANNTTDLRTLLEPEFRVLANGHQDDDFYGIRVSCHFIVAERL